MNDNQNLNPKKKALGRGLNALLQSPETDITAKDISGNFVVGAIANIPLNQIETNPFQPREDFDEIELTELAASIKKQGIIQPITVRKLGFDKYQLISGERRFKASAMVGLEDIPAYIRIANDLQMLEMALVENIQRANLNPIEVAIAYQRLIEECNLTQEELSKQVGKDRTTISNYLRLLKLPAEIQIALRNNELTMGHARALINLENTEEQLAIFKEIIAQELSVRQVEAFVRENNFIPQKGNKAKNKYDLSDHFKNIQKRLADSLNAKINLKVNNKGKGNLVISFKSSEDLERIINLLNK